MTTAAFTTRSVAAAAAVLGTLMFAPTPASGGSSARSITISISTPTNNQTISGSVQFLVTTSGAVKRVDFQIDGLTKRTDTRSPFSFNGHTGLLDSTSLANGQHKLGAIGYDRYGGSVSATVEVSVANLQPSLNLPPLMTSTPQISGTTQVGQILRASAGTWSGTTPMTYAYDWQRCDATGANCAASLVTGASYALGSRDIGSTIRARVTATNVAGTASATSAATDSVAAVPPAPISGPSISGTAQVGQTLTASTGTWSGTTPMTYAYSWQRCDSAGSSCTVIGGATTSTYMLAAGDAGFTLRDRVTATNSGGAARKR